MKKCSCGSDEISKIEFNIHGPVSFKMRRAYECAQCGRLEDIIEESGVQETITTSVEDHMQRILDAYVDGGSFSDISYSIDEILKLVGSDKTTDDLMVY